MPKVSIVVPVFNQPALTKCCLHALQDGTQRDLYELIEKVVDRCRDVGNVVMDIVLKSS